jgi:hypothetical protein
LHQQQERKMAFQWFPMLLLASLCASGCSTHMAYQAVQEMQRAQCDKLTDWQESQRCRAHARQGYDNYQRDRAREATPLTE